MPCAVRAELSTVCSSTCIYSEARLYTHTEYVPLSQALVAKSAAQGGNRSKTSGASADAKKRRQHVFVTPDLKSRVGIKWTAWTSSVVPAVRLRDS